MKFMQNMLFFRCGVNQKTVCYFFFQFSPTPFNRMWEWFHRAAPHWCVQAFPSVSSCEDLRQTAQWDYEWRLELPATSCTFPAVVKHHCLLGEIRLRCWMNFMLVTGWDLNIDGALLDSPAAQQPTSWSSVYHQILSYREILFLSFLFPAFFNPLPLNTVPSRQTINLANGKSLQNGAQAEQHTDLKHTWGRERQGKALN